MIQTEPVRDCISHALGLIRPKHEKGMVSFPSRVLSVLLVAALFLEDVCCIMNIFPGREM